MFSWNIQKNTINILHSKFYIKFFPKKNMGQTIRKYRTVDPIFGELPFYSIKKNTPKMKELEQIYNFNNIFFIKLLRMNIGGPLKFKVIFKKDFFYIHYSIRY